MSPRGIRVRRSRVPKRTIWLAAGTGLHGVDPQAEVALTATSLVLPEHVTLPVRPHRLAVAVATCGALLLATGCGMDEGDAAAEQAAADAGPGSAGSSATATASPSASESASASPSASATPSDSTSPTTRATASDAGGAGTAGDSATVGGPGSGSGTGTSTQPDPAPGADAPDFPVPVEAGNATQLITVEARGSHATVTAWAKGYADWKAQFSTASAWRRVARACRTTSSRTTTGGWRTPSRSSTTPCTARRARTSR